MTMPDTYARFRPNADGQFNYSFDQPNTQVDLDSLRDSLRIFEERGLDTTELKSRINQITAEILGKRDPNSNPGVNAVYPK